ncbi:protein NRT1/ PTR FAMILY 2.6-like [Pyrus communis]|uniref:protein NRT1/ PTR FAMILY 2.6-like n=1 Tax=Pyrus communis TaxID=23211 RepID=UPI0035C2274D
MDGSLSHNDHEAHTSSDSGGRRGGWKTFPFITGALAGLTLAAGGWLSNLIVYLIQEFNVKSIDAAQISNIVAGSSSFFPVIGAIIADSFSGPFSVISISSCISLLGIVLLALTATFNSLKPQTCVNDGSELCKPTSTIQYAILYTSIALATIGLGGTRYTMATMGANQFKNPKTQASFFNWYFFILYAASVVSITVIVYVEDNVSWKLGFGLCVIANILGLVIFLCGTRFYRFDKPQGSPFVDLARVVVASTWKRNLQHSSDESKDYYYGHGGVTDMVDATPSKSFGFLNRAAQKTEGDIKSDGSAKQWRLCTVQQVEDFKTLMRILPLWSSSIFLGTPIAVHSSLTILQALTMDRHIGPHFKIPAGSILVIVLISTAISLTLIDRFLCPVWQKMTGRFPTSLQRIGLGHVLNVLSMAVSALVESKRLTAVKSHHLQDQPGAVVPMLALWLFPQLVLVGIGEAFHFPGQVSLYYQEFPVSLRSTSTAMIALVVGISFYLGTGVIDLVRKVTRWLPDNINNGKLDNVYWMLVVVGVLNFGYYLVCAKLYKYQNVKGANENPGPEGDK